MLLRLIQGTRRLILRESMRIERCHTYVAHGHVFCVCSRWSSHNFPCSPFDWRDGNFNFDPCYIHPCMPLQGATRVSDVTLQDRSDVTLQDRSSALAEQRVYTHRDASKGITLGCVPFFGCCRKELFGCTAQLAWSALPAKRATQLHLERRRASARSSF
jgi:hypothetical protein